MSNGFDSITPLAAYMQLSPFTQQGLPSFAQQSNWQPPGQPSLQQPQTPPLTPPTLGQGAPQQMAFNLSGAQPQSPIAQALQPKQAAPQSPLGAQAGMSWLDKMQPWLMALNFLSSQSQPTTIGGGRGGGFSTSSGGLL